MSNNWCFLWELSLLLSLLNLLVQILGDLLLDRRIRHLDFLLKISGVEERSELPLLLSRNLIIRQSERMLDDLLECMELLFFLGDIENQLLGYAVLNLTQYL